MSTELSLTPDGDASVSAGGDLVGARFWVRAWGQIFDLVVHNALWLISALALGFGVGIYAAIADISVEPLVKKLSASSWSWSGFIAACLGFTSYHAVMERMSGATVGKRLLGLVVISSDGKPLRFRAALGRSLAFYVDSLFFGLPAYDTMKPPPHQRLGDKWCNTLVVKRSMVPVGSASPGSFIGALFLGLLADSLCYFAAVGVGLL